MAKIYNEGFSRRRCGAERNKAGNGLLLFGIIILCGCSQMQEKLLIMEGNFYNSRGMFNEAIAAYMKANEYEEAMPYSEFGLGAVYFTMGEGKAALDRFASASEKLELSPIAGQELRYRILYNTGVALFSEGDFSGAADAFRESLKVDGAKIEAKRNLELSIRSLMREAPSSGGFTDDNGSENESMAALYEYIRRKESDQWQSREWQKEEESNEPDY